LATSRQYGNALLGVRHQEEEDGRQPPSWILSEVKMTPAEVAADLYVSL